MYQVACFNHLSVHCGGRSVDYLDVATCSNRQTSTHWFRQFQPLKPSVNPTVLTDPIGSDHAESFQSMLGATKHLQIMLSETFHRQFALRQSGLGVFPIRLRAHHAHSPATAARTPRVTRFPEEVPEEVEPCASLWLEFKDDLAASRDRGHSSVEGPEAARDLSALENRKAAKGSLDRAESPFLSDMLRQRQAKLRVFGVCVQAAYCS